MRRNINKRRTFVISYSIFFLECSRLKFATLRSRASYRSFSGPGSGEDISSQGCSEQRRKADRPKELGTTFSRGPYNGLKILPLSTLTTLVPRPRRWPSRLRSCERLPGYLSLFPSPFGRGAAPVTAQDLRRRNIYRVSTALCTLKL